MNEFLEAETAIAKKLHVEGALSYWDASASGKDEDYARYEAACFAAAEYYNNAQRYSKVKELLASCKDPLQSRQLQVLLHSYLAEQGDLKLREELIRKASAVEKKFNKYRATIEGKPHTDNEIKEILRKETDSERLREAWEASKKQGELVAPDVIELVKIRNKLARDLGYDNYYRFSLELQEQSEERIAVVFDDLTKLTDEPYRLLKRDIDNFLCKRLSLSVNELKPWHYQDLFFQEGPEMYEANLDKFYSEDPLPAVKEFFASIGLSVEPILERSDQYERPGKQQNAFCMDVDREGDVRIMQNIKNNEYWTGVTLHELGHGVHFQYMERKLPWLLRSAHTLVTESISMLFGRQSKDLHFLKQYTDINDAELATILPVLRNVQRIGMLVFARWVPVMFHFERQLYADPDQDLNVLWWSLVKKYQLIDFSRDKPDWASKTHIVSSPAYYHNYLFGELLASQHHKRISEILGVIDVHDVDYIGRAEVGDYLLRGVFALGDSLPWDELIERATGEKLNPKYFVEQFAR